MNGPAKYQEKKSSLKRLGIFFLKIGIQRAKVYTKNVLNIEVEACNFIPANARILSIKRIIVVVELMQPCVSIFLKQIS